MIKKTIKPDTERILSSLKDFQKKTVNQVFNRLYEEPDCVDRFLIADEVGLGKTLIARGVIAKAVEKLWDYVPRIDIIYICSNGDIARQNINRLNITGKSDFSRATRMTMLPIQIHDLKNNKLNFVSFTPGTSFNLRSSGGVYSERVMLYYMLKKALNYGNRAPLKNIFRCDVGRNNWRYHLKIFDPNSIDKGIQNKFLKAFKKDKKLTNKLKELLDDFSWDRKRFSYEIRRRQSSFIGKLRKMLAEICIDALEPDIIILDEFQRFKNLLNSNDEVGKLAERLFKFQNKEANVKLMLLSATPYKMYTMFQETGDDDHYKDFFNTLYFLFNSDNEKSEKFKAFLKVYREDLYKYNRKNGLNLAKAKKQVEGVLKKVMVRTEKLAASIDRNGMVVESDDDLGFITAKELQSFKLLDRVTSAIGARNSIEYWKSSPYILNVMDRSGYKVKEILYKRIKTNHTHNDLVNIFNGAGKHLLNWETIQKYEKVDPSNTKLRTLIRNIAAKDLWKLLWVPASQPYYETNSGPYANREIRGVTKSLIFSSWQVVPKVISQLCSYEAERIIFSELNSLNEYNEESRKRRPLLNFTFSDDRLTGMSNFTLLYPSLTLAKEIDPLILGVDNSTDNSIPALKDIQKKITTKIESLLSPLIGKYGKGSVQTSERWYWAALILLDRHYHKDSYISWLNSEDEDYKWREMIPPREKNTEAESKFSDHIDLLQKFFKDETYDEMFSEIGPPPKDLIKVLTNIAIASPAVVILRSLMRQSENRDYTSFSTEYLGSAAYAAVEFRTLFNLPYAMVLIQRYASEKHPYWRDVLEYCTKGNLQAVIDEYVHILRESLGLIDAGVIKIIKDIAKEIGSAVSIRTINLSFDDIKTNNEKNRIELEQHTIRCRFALRFGDAKDEDGEVTRSDHVRRAFNSPFHPFILATTSIGQEGLDFHHYCHDIYHWNLPSNPVDLEQREGRVHRFKGHAVRKNVAETVSLHALNGNISILDDEWETMFALCKAMRSKELNDLVPYWISDSKNKRNRYKICRHIPSLALSKEIQQMDNLRKSLIAYRMVFGQPRQEDLVRYLQKQSESNNIELEELLKYRIDLSPE